MSDFSNIDQFSMFAPADLLGGVQPNLGGPLNQVNNAFVQLVALLENNGRGVLSAHELTHRLKSLSSKSGSNSIDLSKYITMYTINQVVALGPGTDKAKMYRLNDGTAGSINNIQQIVGKDFPAPVTSAPFNTSIILSRSPFFNPSTRNTKKAETFLNSMPSVMLAQLSPYMQVEFQMTRDPSDKLQTASLLKFLLGAVKKDNLGANAAMVSGHQTTSIDKKTELDFAGMELFTSPQTLVNPRPNQNVGTDGVRYANVIDPFRPLASLEHVTVNAVPAVGIFSYKKATMTIKLHDRSRLAEISDLIRPRVYTGVTVWLTYGWRAPVRGGKNPYFDYVNNNMLMREAYGIINSNFSFDNTGQVTITLELFTKGVAELRQLKISDNKLDMAFRTDEVKRLIEQISNYRQRLRLDPPEGLNKEIRTFQVLDAAESGAFPDLKADEVNKSIDQLNEALNKAAGVDKDALNGLISSMKKLYQPDNSDKTKFSFKERFQTRVTNTVAAMFDEVRTGPDPFLPTAGKDCDPEIIKACDELNKPTSIKVDRFQKSAVSFGKLFSVFALRAIQSATTLFDEVQVFFYNLNEQCGPISSHSVAEFPIDMSQFLDQFREHCIARGGERITLEEFLQLAINAQFLDNRAIGYGLRRYYEPYNPKNRDAQVRKDQEGAFESALAAQTNKYGPFKRPVIEMHAEVSHERVSEEGDSDILQQMNYSAIDASTTSFADIKGKSTRKILRLHVYDKQTNAYKAASRLLRNTANTGFLETPATDLAKKHTSFEQDKLVKQLTDLQEDEKRGNVQLLKVTSNQQIKEIIAKLVPTIRYGSNGSTITQANLASKADPLLSTVQMIRSMTVKNTASPNGGGDSGIPLRVIPAQLTLTTLGNPLATMAQQYFVDFNTGTTLDNLYIVIGLTHTFSVGKFETQWTLGYSDGYGVFEGAPNIVKAISALKTGAT